MSLLDSLRGVINVTQPLPWLVTAGQPSESQSRDASAGGIKTVIDARDPGEPRPFDEPTLVRELGMSYYSVPVVHGALSDEVMTDALEALRKSAGTATLFHCSSANRTGGPLIAYLMIDEGVAQDAAVDTAMRSGLRSAELMEWAVEYAERHPKS